MYSARLLLCLKNRVFSLRTVFYVFFFFLFFFAPFDRASVFCAEEKIEVTLKVFPSQYTLYIDGRKVTPFPGVNFTRQVYVSRGTHIFHFQQPGYKDKLLSISLEGSVLVEEKLEKEKAKLLLFGEVQTGRQPKSVEFSPDGNYFFTALLDDTGIDVFETRTCIHVGRLSPPKAWAVQRGFVEILFLEKREEIWVSQMTTGAVHVFDVKEHSYKKTIHTGGRWTKVLISNSDESMVYASNWESNDISVIDTRSYSVVDTIALKGTPRGMALHPNEEYLYVCLYDSGSVEKVDLKTGSVISSFFLRGGSKRHIEIDRERGRFYISDMYWGSVYVFDFRKDSLVKEVPIDYNPNTITLSRDGRYLFISTRGPNNPRSYLIKGFVFGKIYVLDTKNLTVVDWFWGKNQPTGLDLSPDNRFLAYSNFKDNTIEIYWNDYSGY